MKQNRKLFSRRNILIAVAILIVALVGFSVWWLQPYPATGSAGAILATSGYIDVSNKYFLFSPKQEINKAGVIIYPGGKVDPTAYSPICNKIAEKGYPCIIVEMPLNLAIFDIQAADRVIDKFPGYNWLIAGHSLGGSMAARYIGSNSSQSKQIKGLALLSAYSDISIKDKQIKVVTFLPSEDKVLNRNTWSSSASSLPVDTEVVEIPGGNHSGYAYYGPQDGDGQPTITKDAQIDIVVGKMVEMLSSIAP